MKEWDARMCVIVIIVGIMKRKRKYSPNINNTNSHLSPQLTEHKKGRRHMTLEIQV
jgi:hypothetical protein